MEIVQAYAGLRAQPYRAEIIYACGLPAWQALGAQAGGVEIVQACAGLRGVGLAEQRM
jgi:hypothetical protein